MKSLGWKKHAELGCLNLCVESWAVVTLLTSLWNGGYWLRSLSLWISEPISPHSSPRKQSINIFPKLAFLQKDDFSLLHVSSREKSVTLNPVCAMNFVMNRHVGQFLSFLAVHANKPDSCCILDEEDKGVVGLICICCGPTQCSTRWPPCGWVPASYQVSYWLICHHVLSFSLEIPVLKLPYLFICLFLYHSLSHTKAPLDCGSSLPC